MRNITESNMLLRTPLALPEDLGVATETFREGWQFVRTANAKKMKQKIKARGWNFIRIGDGSLRSGVGDTSQEAIASALRLALLRVGKQFSAAEVEHIEISRYPWFFLARVRVYPYWIQQSEDLPLPVSAPAPPQFPRQRRLPLNAAALYPQFGSAMPMLKQMLVSSRVR